MKSSIFKRIGLIALAICIAIGSFFVNVQKNGHNRSLIANASDNVDTSYTFNGSSLLICCTSYWTGSSDENMRFGFGNFGFTINSSDVVSYTINGYLQYYPDSVEQGTDLNSTFNVSTNATYNKIILSDRFGYSTYMYCISKLSSSEFIANIIKVRIYSSVVDNSQYNTFIEYYDVNGNYLTLQLFAYSPNNSTPLKFLYEDRTYYFTDSLVLDDNQIYNQGYQDGISDNQQNIFSSGYNAGYDIGYGNGVTAGRADANDFSFISLIGAVVDVPLQTFLGLFHFELLGINLANFFLALLTVAFIIFIIKLILGKG